MHRHLKNEKQTCFKNEEICCITNEGKTAKNEWENDFSRFIQSIQKIRAILFPYSTEHVR